MRRSVALLIGLVLSVFVHSAFAQTTATGSSPHQTISYQGLLRAADGKPVTDGDYQVTVRLYSDETGSQEIWHDTYLTHVTDGVFSILLGSGTQALPAPTEMDHGLWLGTQIGATNELRPLTALTAAPFAMNVADKSITEKKIEADYVRSISINGQKAIGRASDINIVTGNGIEATFDPATNAIMMKGSALSNLGTQNGAFTQGSGDFLPNTNHVGGLGNSTHWWNSLWADSIHTTMPAGVVHSAGNGGLLYSTSVALNADVSGVLPEAHGGTGQSSYSKGDILYAPSSGATLSKRSIGLTGQVLQVSSSGLPEWTSVIAPPTNNSGALGAPDKRFADLYLGPHSLNISDGSIETDLSLGTPDSVTGTTSTALVVSVDSSTQMAITSDGVAVAGDLSTQGSLTTTGDITTTGSLTTSGDISTDGSLTTTGDITTSGSLTTSGDITSTGDLSTTGTITTTSDLSTAGALTIGTDAVILRANPTMHEDIPYYLPAGRPSGSDIYLKAGSGSGTNQDPYVMTWGSVDASDIANGSIANAKLTNSTIGITSTGSTMTVSGSPIALGSAGNVDLNLAHANTWTATQSFSAKATSASTVSGDNANTITTKDYVDAAYATNAAAISTETSRAEAAETTLQSNINSEASTRSTADNTLQANINTEASTRSSADNTLQANINSEASTRSTADNTLQSNITSEVNARTSADNTLQANISSEATTRSAADNTLQSNIDAEAATRASAITTLTNNLATTNTNLSNEITRAEAAENTLQSNINAEASTRLSADNTLQANINTEASSRNSADNTLSSAITAETTRAQAAEATKENAANVTADARAAFSAGSGISISSGVISATNNGSYINNGTSQQAGANFNIAGSGQVGTTMTAGGNINTTGGVYQIGGNIVLANHGAGSSNINGNIFVGTSTGVSNTTGYNNTFMGNTAGLNNVDGAFNTYIGTSAGLSGTSGNFNTAVGSVAGYHITTGAGNTYIGHFAGSGTTTGGTNTIAGYYAGTGISTGSDNVIMGKYAGRNTTGDRNTYIGSDASSYIASGSENTSLGWDGGMSDGLTNATAIGARAYVTQSNSIVLGSIVGYQSAGAGTNVGIGTPAPAHKLDVIGDINAASGYLYNGAAPSGQYLRGNGTNFVSSPLLASDLSGSFSTISSNGLVTIGTQPGDPSSVSADTRLRLKATNGNQNTWDYGVVNNGDLGYVESYYDNFGYYLDDDNNVGTASSFTINRGASHTGSPFNMLTLAGTGNLTVSGTLNGTALNVSSGNISMPFNKSIGSANNTDAFTYDGKTIGHYSMGFYNDSWNSSPTGWLSAYAGFKLFSAGALMAQINGDFAKLWGVLQANGGLDMLNNTIANVSHINNGTGGTIAIDGNVDFNNHNLSNLGYVSLNSTSTLSAVSGTVNFGSDIDARNHSIFNVTDPVSAHDAATKNYVDNAASSANFIRNGSSQQSSANFNISGNGAIGGQLTASTAGIGTNSPAAPLEVKSQTPGSLLRVSSPNGNGDIEMNSSYRPTIYPYGPNVPANGLDFQIRSAGNGILGLNFDDGADVIIGRSTNRGGSNVGIGPSWDINNLPVARLDVDGDARVTRNMGTVSNGTYYGVHSSISTGTGNVVNIIGVYGASSGTDDLSVGVQGLGTGTGGGTTIGGDFSAHNVSSQGTAIAVRADATGATNNIAVEATNGDVYVTDHNKGIILKDANNNCWRVTVNTSGQLVTTQLSVCPN